MPLILNKHYSVAYLVPLWQQQLRQIGTILELKQVIKNCVAVSCS